MLLNSAIEAQDLVEENKVSVSSNPLNNLIEDSINSEAGLLKESARNQNISFGVSVTDENTMRNIPQQQEAENI